MDHSGPSFALVISASSVAWHELAPRPEMGVGVWMWVQFSCLQMESHCPLPRLWGHRKRWWDGAALPCRQEHSSRLPSRSAWEQETDAPAHLDLIKPNACFPIQISLETVKSPGSAEWGRKALSEEGGCCHLWCLLLPREFALNSFQHNPPNYVIFVPEELCCFYGVPKILSIFPLI